MQFSSVLVVIASNLGVVFVLGDTLSGVRRQKVFAVGELPLFSEQVDKSLGDLGVAVLAGGTVGVQPA